MDADRLEGVVHQFKGKVKEVVGRMTGDTKTQAEGKVEKNAGKVENTVGSAKDTVRNSAKD